MASVRRKLAVVSPCFWKVSRSLKRFTPDSLSLARDCFERAIREDRDNPSIYVAMADYYAAAAVLAVREPKQLLPKAEWAATAHWKWIRWNPGAHASLAVVQAIYHCRWDFAAVTCAARWKSEAHFQPYLFVLAAGLRESPNDRYTRRSRLSRSGAVPYRRLVRSLSAGAICRATEPHSGPRHFCRPWRTAHGAALRSSVVA